MTKVYCNYYYLKITTRTSNVEQLKIVVNRMTSLPINYIQLINDRKSFSSDHRSFKHKNQIRKLGLIESIVEEEFKESSTKKVF